MMADALAGDMAPDSTEHVDELAARRNARMVAAANGMDLCTCGWNGGPTGCEVPGHG